MLYYTVTFIFFHLLDLCLFQMHVFIKSTDCILLSSFELKGTLSGLRQFLATESPVKMMKNAFYFTLTALFVLKIHKFLF